MNQPVPLRLVKAQTCAKPTLRPSCVLGHDAQLFRRYARYVAFIGFKLLGQESDVDDLVQQVFLEAFKRSEQLRDPAAAKGWLATITVRTARRQLRRRKLRHFVGLDDREALQLSAAGVSPENRGLIARVYQILDTVPVNQRLAWTLRRVEGEKLELVAQRCGCSTATAKRWIAATHAHLQVQLDER